MPNAIEIKDLAKNHAGEKALRGLDMVVPDPCLFGIIGADGAGKSTLMNILATLSDPDSGKVTMLTFDLGRQFTQIRAHIGYMPQRFSLYQDLSVLENLDFFADIFGIVGQEKIARMEQLLDFAGLQSFRQRRAGLLSGGMKQKLALACTLIHQPRLLLLDEPTVGVDPVARGDFWTMLKSLRKQSITIVVSTPYMDEATLCDQLILLHEGAILAQSTPSKLLAEYPYRLYRIEAGELNSDAEHSFGHTTLTYPGDRPPPPGFELVYPSSGALHAAEKITAPSEANSSDPSYIAQQTAAALARLAPSVPGAAQATIIPPTLEDCFFALLHEHSATRQA